MDTVKTFVSDINKQPYVSLEGKIDFDTSALPKIQKIMSRHDSIDDFIKNESLSNKMVIARYLHTGKWEDKPISLAKIDDRTARDWGDMILKDYAGIDTRGLIKVDVGIGAHVDEFALEKKIDNTFRHYLDSEYQGSKMKAGRVFQELQGYYKVGNANRLVARLDDAVKGDVSTPAEAKAILNNKGIDSFDPSYKLRFAYLLEDPTGRGGVKKSVVLHNLNEHQDFEDDLDKKIFSKPAKAVELTVSSADASDAGRELSEYGHQKAKYKVTSHKSNKSKSRRNSTAGIGSAR